MKLAHFIGKSQIAAMWHGYNGEEGDWFLAKLKELEAITDAMPEPYATDGKGDAAIAHLHYFGPSQDWWISERDSTPEQLQAFGLADLGYGGGLGYISIAELIANGIELDLHWTPRTLAECRQRQAD